MFIIEKQNLRPNKKIETPLSTKPKNNNTNFPPATKNHTQTHISKHRKILQFCAFSQPSPSYPPAKNQIHISLNTEIVCPFFSGPPPKKSLQKLPRYIFPAHGPKVINARRPGSTKRLNMLMVTNDLRFHGRRLLGVFKKKQKLTWPLSAVECWQVNTSNC